MKLSVLSMAVVFLAGPVVAAAGDLEDAFQNLKAAEEKKDAAQVKKLAVEIFGLTCNVIASTAPQDPDEKEAWASRVEYAKTTGLHAEYALYATAIQSPPAVMVDLMSTLEQQNPKSQYLAAGYGPYLAALARTGGAAKVPAVAEKALENFPDNEDLLQVMADTALSRNQSDRALGYANRLITVLVQHPRPEGVPAADWERKRTAELGRGYWIAGVVYAGKGQFVPADKNLRAALPLIKGNPAMLGAALFHLGVANYNLGKATNNKARVLEGAKFSEDAAAIDSPYSQQAWHNATVMKTEAGRMR